MRSLPLPPSWHNRTLVLEGIGDDPASWFSDEELAEADAFPRARRREEWLLSRYALKRLAVARGLAQDPRGLAVTRPQLAGGAWISISHSHGLAAAAIDDLPVGVDIERIRPLDEHVARHFLIESEIGAMERCTVPHRVLHWWCAKEAAWKQRNGAVRFLKEVPLLLERESATGLSFHGVDTFATPEYVVALTR